MKPHGQRCCIFLEPESSRDRERRNVGVEGAVVRHKSAVARLGRDPAHDRPSIAAASVRRMGEDADVRQGPAPDPVTRRRHELALAKAAKQRRVVELETAVLPLCLVASRGQAVERGFVIAVQKAPLVGARRPEAFVVRRNRTRPGR